MKFTVSIHAIARRSAMIVARLAEEALMAKKDHSERKKEQRRKQLDQSVETPRGPIKNMFDMQYVENEDEERTDVPPGSNSGSQTGGYHYISPEEPAEGGRDKY